MCLFWNSFCSSFTTTTWGNLVRLNIYCKNDRDRNMKNNSIENYIIIFSEEMKAWRINISIPAYVSVVRGKLMCVEPGCEPASAWRCPLQWCLKETDVCVDPRWVLSQKYRAYMCLIHIHIQGMHHTVSLLQNHWLDSLSPVCARRQTQCVTWMFPCLSVWSKLTKERLWIKQRHSQGRFIIDSI